MSLPDDLRDAGMRYPEGLPEGGGVVSPTPRLVILGDGRMGRAIEDLASAHGLEVEAVFGREALTGDEPRVRAALVASDVAIEVSVPSAAVENAHLCLEAGCAVVVGTTGWYDRLPEIEARVAETGGSLLWAANFSLGITLMRALCERAGALVARAGGFDASLVETHHAQKRDAPSGTAEVLARSTEAELGAEVPITSVRVGQVPGTHELVIWGRRDRRSYG